MNHIRLCLSLFLLGGAISYSHAQDKPDKYALLIGVNAYDYDYFGPLKFPEDDAKAIGQVLAESGYEVDLLPGSNATKEAIENKLAGLNQRGSNKGVVFVGVFGHGIEFALMNLSYFCPFDTYGRTARHKDNKELFAATPAGTSAKKLIEPDPTSMISIDTLMESLTLCKAANRALIADCCRDDTNRARSRSFGSSLQTNQLPANTVTLFACAANQRAMEHDSWQHGALTKCFLDELNQSNASGPVTMVSIAPKMTEAVDRLVKSSDARGEQTPRFLATGSADLLFDKKSTANGSWINLDEAKRRVLQSRKILAKYPRKAVAQHSDSMLVLQAWSYAKLGDETGVYDTIVELSRQFGWCPSEELGRIIGVLSRQKPKLNVNRFLETLLAKTDSLKECFTSDNFRFGIVNSDVFEMELSKGAAYRRALSSTVLDDSDLITIAYNPSILLEDHNGMLHSKLEAVSNANSKDSDNRLLAASILGDTQKVMQLLPVHDEPIAVVPFVHRNDVFVVQQIIQRKKPNYAGYLFVALNASLASRRFAIAEELLEKFEIPSHGSKIRYRSCESVRDKLCPVCSGKYGSHYTHARTVHGDFAWIYGRLNNETVFQKILQPIQVEATRRDVEISFAAGLLEDIPPTLLMEATK